MLVHGGRVVQRNEGFGRWWPAGNREANAERRRLHILLKREGVAVNWKKLCRLYKEERLTVRKRPSRQLLRNLPVDGWP